VRRVVGAIGRTFITVGILILLFVAFQLWGTGFYTAREQDQLEQQFNAALRSDGRDAATPTTTTTLLGTAGPTTTTTTTEPAPSPAPPPEGAAVARIRIPKIGVDSIVVNGVTRDDLRKGPGHYPNTPLPGQEGNSAIAGHRTTYGAPFGDLDQLAPDDLIEVRTLQGSFRYRVTEQLIVAPSDIAVIDPTPKSRDDPSAGFAATLTLTTCNPKYSAAQRLVVKADIEPDQVALPAPESTVSPTITEEGLSGEEGSKLPTLLSGLVVLLIGALWWLFFHRHPRWTTWIIGAIPFAVALFIFYSYLERVLPANY
jgi:sortase A